MRKQILVIEDQLSTRKLLCHYLGNFYEVIGQQSAIDAIEWLKQGNNPDAIVVDLMMPEMTGIEFLTTINALNLNTNSVLILSSVETSSEKLKCFNLGAKDYLVKPFNPQELNIRISNLIKSKQLTTTLIN